MQRHFVRIVGHACTHISTDSVCTRPDGYTRLLCQEFCMLFNIIIALFYKHVILDHIILCMQARQSYACT